MIAVLATLAMLVLVPSLSWVIWRCTSISNFNGVYRDCLCIGHSASFDITFRSVVEVHGAAQNGLRWRGSRYVSSDCHRIWIESAEYANPTVAEARLQQLTKGFWIVVREPRPGSAGKQDSVRVVAIHPNESPKALILRRGARWIVKIHGDSLFHMLILEDRELEKW